VINEDLVLTTDHPKASEMKIPLYLQVLSD
jgi:hypothetical protein